MKKMFLALIALVGAIMFSSCDSTLDANHWGSTQYYRDFLFSECPPVTMEKTLSVAFNEDASDLTSPLVLALYRKAGEDAPVRVSTEEAEVYVNGEKSRDNTISLLPSASPGEEQKLKIGIVLTPATLESGSKDQTLTYLLKMEKNPGLDYINDVVVLGQNSLVLEADPWTPMTVYLDYVANKLEVGVKIGFWTLLAALVVWLLLAHFVFWTSPFSKVYIDYNDGVGERPVSMSGCYQLCLTANRKAKDGFLKKIFKGSQRYEVNDFWEHDVIIKKRSSGRRLSVTPQRLFTVEGEAIRQETFAIVNSKGEKVTIRTT